ncbi:MAG: catalase, partial [Actinobacteria bacterium]|nr:catalase [Actinomycetota bacterium]
LSANGEFVHVAYSKREVDEDWSQPGALVREVMDDAARDRLVSNVAGHLSDGVSDKVLQRAFEYWRNIDKETGDRIAKAVNGG